MHNIPQFKQTLSLFSLPDTLSLSLACFHTLSSTHIKTRKHSHRYCESQRDEHDYTNIRNNHTELPRALKSKDEDDFTDSAGVIGDSLTQTDTSMQVMHHQMEKWQSVGVETALYCRVCVSAKLRSTITQPEPDFLCISGDKLQHTHTHKICLLCRITHCFPGKASNHLPKVKGQMKRKLYMEHNQHTFCRQTDRGSHKHINKNSQVTSTKH